MAKNYVQSLEVLQLTVVDFPNSLIYYFIAIPVIKPANTLLL